MRRDADYFGDRPLALVFIAKKLREALAVEQLLEKGGIDYLVEVDYYVGGLIFRSERAGAFIYVEEDRLGLASGVIAAAGHRPHEALAGGS